MKHLRNNGMLDRRFYSSRPDVIAKQKLETLKLRNSYLAIIVLGILAGLILGKTFYDANHKPLSNPRGIGQIVKEVEAKEKDWSTDLVGYFRYRGQEIGYNDYDITKFHEVMDCENGLHTAGRVNYLYDGENGRYTAAGFAMITNSTWRQHKCEGSKWNGLDNINCFYKIIGKNGLKDYYESKNKWGKLFDESSIKFIKL